MKESLKNDIKTTGEKLDGFYLEVTIFKQSIPNFTIGYQRLLEVEDLRLWKLEAKYKSPPNVLSVLERIASTHRIIIKPFSELDP